MATLSVVCNEAELGDAVAVAGTYYPTPRRHSVLLTSFVCIGIQYSFD
eukprot:COSAG02_NODE_2949_length_7680_cov_4.274238_1_plen_48_part_00